MRHKGSIGHGFSWSKLQKTFRSISRASSSCSFARLLANTNAEALGDDCFGEEHCRQAEARQHYLQVTDQYFAKAAATSTDLLAQNLQPGADTCCQDTTADPEELSDHEDSHMYSTCGASVARPAGLEPATPGSEDQCGCRSKEALIASQGNDLRR